MTQLPGHLAHLSPRQREEIVRRVEGGEESMRAIASAMGLNESTVSRTYKRWCESGDVVEHLAGGHTSAYDDDDLYQLPCSHCNDSQAQSSPTDCVPCHQQLHDNMQLSMTEM
jgi:Helix-turn-helix domain